LEALHGVGDAKLGEWVEPPDEWRTAYHIRRRLTPQEELVTGPVKDVRGTPEALERVEVVLRQCPNRPHLWKLVREELGFEV
jgi:hypothetical protein